MNVSRHKSWPHHFSGGKSSVWYCWLVDTNQGGSGVVPFALAAISLTQNLNTKLHTTH